MLIRMTELAKRNWVRSHHRYNSTLFLSLREKAIRKLPRSLASFLRGKKWPSWQEHCRTEVDLGVDGNRSILGSALGS